MEANNIIEEHAELTDQVAQLSEERDTLATELEAVRVEFAKLSEDVNEVLQDNEDLEAENELLKKQVAEAEDTDREVDDEVAEQVVEKVAEIVGTEPVEDEAQVTAETSRDDLVAHFLSITDAAEKGRFWDENKTKLLNR